MINKSIKKVNLDRKNKKILYELDLNSRQSYSEIGKKVGLSKFMVNYRIKQMENSGLIKKYYPIIDVSKLGYLTFRVFIKLLYVSPQKEDEILKFLKKQVMVGWLVNVTGYWDINMLVWAKSVYDFKKFWDEFLFKYRKYITDKMVTNILYMSMHKKSFLLDLEKDTTEPEVCGGEINVKVDQKDIGVLKLLSQDGNMSLVKMSEKLKISSKVIDYRIKKMIKQKVILSFRALLDLNMLGIIYFKVFYHLHRMSKESTKQMIHWAKNHPNNMITITPVGGADLELEFYVFKYEKIHEINREFWEKFKKQVRNIETMDYHKEHKWNFIPL